MERQDFENAVSELYEYFRYNQPPGYGAIDRWYAKIKFIPSTALPWIIDQSEELETLPRNIPKLFKKQWHIYQKAHPEKTISVEEQCDDCHTTGILFFRKVETTYNPPMPVDYVCICGRCNNSRSKFGSLIRHGGTEKETGRYVDPTLKLTKTEIEDRGWEFLPSGGKYFKKVDGKRIYGKLPEVDMKEIPRTPTKYTGPRPEGV